MSRKDLVQIIRDNPKCFALIDNDCWSLYKEDPTKQKFLDNAELAEANELADSGDYFKDLPDCGYGSGSSYGGDILQALAKIVGITVESV